MFGVLRYAFQEVEIVISQSRDSGISKTLRVGL